MARKLRGFERVLDAPALFAVAYGEIRVLALHRARDRRRSGARPDPLVLLLTGALFLVVSLSYAEGDPHLPRPAARDLRAAGVQRPRGLRDRMGLFLDFLIVLALSALFAHYVAAAISTPTLRDDPGTL